MTFLPAPTLNAYLSVGAAAGGVAPGTAYATDRPAAGPRAISHHAEAGEGGEPAAEPYQTQTRHQRHRQPF